MKKSLLLIPTLALLTGVAFSAQKPIASYAETSEETSVTSSEEISSTESSSKPSAINEIIIDGKTIEQWKKELQDSNTRNTALIAIVMSLLPALVVVIKALIERGIIKKNIASADLLKEKAEEASKAYAEMAKKYEEKITVLEQYLKDACLEAKSTKEMLDIVMKTDPNLVAAEAYKKAHKLLAEIRHDEEE